MHLCNNCDSDIYETIKESRDKRAEKSNKAKVPNIFENQIVFMRDQTPAGQGVSSVLKVPMRGPYRILKIEARNVTLQEIETNKIQHSHVELLRPLSIKEFKLLLSKK